MNEHDDSHDSHDSRNTPTHDFGLRAPGVRDSGHPGPEPHRAEAHEAHGAEAHEPHRAETHEPLGVEVRGPRHPGPEAPDPAFHDPAAHGSPAEPRITLRGPAELADALPYLLGFHPTDSIVLVALHGGSGRFGGRVRVGLPASPQEWPDIADQLADCLVTGSERRGPRPDGIVVFLCQDPAADGTGRQVMERLRPLAQRLRTACGGLDVPVREALCISDGRYWSYCCPDTRCCPAEGSVLALPGTSVMAAAATYAGIQVRGSLREMEERLTPARPRALRMLRARRRHPARRAVRCVPSVGRCAAPPGRGPGCRPGAGGTRTGSRGRPAARGRRRPGRGVRRRSTRTPSRPG